MIKSIHHRRGEHGQGQRKSSSMAAGVSGVPTNTSQSSSFEILAPAQWTAPMVFNSPHSGQVLPDDLVISSTLLPHQLRASEDSHVDALFSGCLEAGAPLMRALVSRAYVDLNREPYELDARMFREKLPSYANTTSPRVASGLGTIPRTVGDGTQIYDEQLNLAEAFQRIETIYRPYHRTLGALLDEALEATGMSLLVDCHSMPSSAVAHLRQPRLPAIDIVLGDRFGSACAPELADIAERHLLQEGLTVSRNRPYSGGFFTEHHGRPHQGRHALQVEINRSIYMDETTRLPNNNFSVLQNSLAKLSLKLAQWLHGQLDDVAPQHKLAAE
jgi:N-formylglutamate amidohydrolase